MAVRGHSPSSEKATITSNWNGTHWMFLNATILLVVTRLCSAGVAGSLRVYPRGTPLPLPTVICLGTRHMAASPRITCWKMVKKEIVCRATSSLRIKCSKVFYREEDLVRSNSVTACGSETDGHDRQLAVSLEKCISAAKES